MLPTDGQGFAFVFTKVWQNDCGEGAADGRGVHSGGLYGVLTPERSSYHGSDIVDRVDRVASRRRAHVAV
jgi:hypothetical protein